MFPKSESPRLEETFIIKSLSLVRPLLQVVLFEFVQVCDAELKITTLS